MLSRDDKSKKSDQNSFFKESSSSFQADSFRTQDQDEWDTEVENENLTPEIQPTKEINSQDNPPSGSSGSELPEAGSNPEADSSNLTIDEYIAQYTNLAAIPVYSPNTASTVPEINTSLILQAKLSIGHPSDQYEQEADRVAAMVMGRRDESFLDQSSSAENNVSLSIQRFADRSKISPKNTQVDANSQAEPSLEAKLNDTQTRGNPLDDSTRQFMESKFGHDFGSIRIHTDTTAIQMNQELGAQAFTYGNHVYYGAGKTPGQNELTAHELTHTIQQTGGVRLKKPPQQLENLPNKIIQNKISTGIQPQIQRKADPGQIIEQIKNAPPSQVTTVYDQGRANSATAWMEQKQELEQSLPQINAATGSVTSSTNPATGKGVGVSNLDTTAKGKASINKESILPKENKQLLTTSVPGLASEPVVKNAPPLHPITPTHIAGGNTGVSDKSENQGNAQVAASAQAALSSVNFNSSQVSTKADSVPKVNLTGATNPEQLAQQQKQTDLDVQQNKLAAAQDIHKERGENQILAQRSHEILKTNKHLSAPSVAGSPAGKSSVVPPEIAGQLDQSLAPNLRSRIDVEQQKYLVGKNKFEQDRTQVRTHADQEIAKLNQENSQKQSETQKTCASEVSAAKSQWQTELDAVEQKYQQQASQATGEHKSKINLEQQKGDEQAAKHLADAEKKAEQEKQKSEQAVNQKKADAEKESGGFWGWVEDKAAAFIDGVKQAVNSIYDHLRQAVKFIFAEAKKLALAAIDLAQQAIATLIQAYGEVLKGIVKLVFAAFPEIAKRLNSKIDQAINLAIQVVNTAADLLKKGIESILDGLASTLDSLIKLVQDIYNGAFTVIGMIVRGEFGELIGKLGNLVSAAKAAPPQFETAGLEELLGGNLDEPLSPAELAQAGITPKVGNTASGSEESSGEIPRAPWTTDNVGVDAVEENMQLSPELQGEIIQKTKHTDQVEIANSHDSSRSIEAMLSEVYGDHTAEQTPEGKEQKNPDDGLSPQQRAKIRWDLMKGGISQWLSQNWPTIILGTTAAIGGFIALNVATGGAITAALPVIMEVVGPLMIGATIGKIGGHISDYLSQGWAGNIQAGGKSLAKGLAAGAIELISYAGLKAGEAALKGVKSLSKGALQGARKLAAEAINLIQKGAKFIVEKGKILLKGVAGAFDRGIKRLKDLGVALLERTRFRKFRIRLENGWFILQGEINPWFDIAKGKIIKVTRETKGAFFKTEKEMEDLEKASQVNTGKVREFEATKYKETTSNNRGVKNDKLTGDHIPSKAALFAAKEQKLSRKLTTSEKRRIEQEGVTVVLKDTNHTDLSRTYGGRNKTAQIAQDAQDLGKAFSMDAEAILEGLYNDKKLTNEVVGAYLKAYNMNVAQGVFRYNSEIDKMLKDFFKKAKK